MDPVTFIRVLNKMNNGNSRSDDEVAHYSVEDHLMKLAGQGRMSG